MSLRKEPLMKNIELVGYDDLNRKPGFQMGMQKFGKKYYLYSASFRHNGWNIVEVTDPANPRNVKWLEGPWVDENIRDGQGTPKIQVADGLMITAHGGMIGFLHGCEDGLPFWGGIMIWDIETDPENPKLLGKFDCAGPGVHRFFYNGGRYVYVTGGAEGFNNYILRIVDIKDPTNPVEVGRWFVPEQNLNNQLPKEEAKLGDHLSVQFLHALTVKDDIAYLAYANKGFVLLDVKDKTQPKLINFLPLNPPFSGGASGAPVHTSYPLGDRPYAVVSTEGERARYFGGDKGGGFGEKLTTQPMNMIGIVELTDIENPSLISVLPYPEVSEGYTHGENFNYVDGVRVPFGPHNCFDAFGTDVYKQIDDKVLNCYFHAGLRIYDVSDPFMPEEIAYFLPPDPEEVWFDNKNNDLMPGAKVAITEDVLVDDRGYIYVDTFQDGLYILKYTGGEL